MPRHQYTQSAAPSMSPLNTEEVKFWLRIMEEHAIFIRAGLPCDQTEFINEAKGFQQEFKNLRTKVEKIQSEKKFCELISQICCSLKEYIRYKRLLLCSVLTGKICGGSLYPSFLDHVIRETEYFMALLSKMGGKTIGMVPALENDFWLRIMADHTLLLRQFVDPSESGLIGAVEGYAEEFGALSAQARVFSSILHCQKTPFPVFERFLKDSKMATTRLRDFKKCLYDMICNNKILTIAPALLADHMRREADHFLLILAMMEKGVVKNCKLNEASAAKYSMGGIFPGEVEREFGELIEYEEINADMDSASDFKRPQWQKQKADDKKVASEKKAPSLKKLLNEESRPPSWEKKHVGFVEESFNSHEKSGQRDIREDDDGNIEEKQFLLSYETESEFEIPDRFPMFLSSHKPDDHHMEAHFLKTRPEKDNNVKAAHSSQVPQTDNSKSPKHKSNSKWPRQLGKVDN